MRALHVIVGWVLIALGLAVATRLASTLSPFGDGVHRLVVMSAGVFGAWIGWIIAGSPTLIVPLERRRASWGELGDAGLWKGEGCALGAARRHALASPETLSHQCGHRLVLGAGRGADDVFIAAASRWPGALLFVDTRGLSGRVSRDDVVRFAPGRPDTVRINPLLAIRRGPHAWRDASILATGLAAGGDGGVVAAMTTVLLDHLHTAAPSERSLDGVRQRLLDPDRVFASIVAAVHDQRADGVWRAHPEIARMARVWRGDPAAARARLVACERALRIFQDGRLAEATGALDLRLADVARDGPKTVLIEAPPGDGALYGPFLAALLGQLLAHVTDAAPTDAWGRAKTRRVLLAIDDPAVLGVIPLLAQRTGAAPRCGVELLVQSGTIDGALGVFGGGAGLAVFDAVAAVGPLAQNTADRLSTHAGSHAALQLRRGYVGETWVGFAPVVEQTACLILPPAELKNRSADRATLLVAGLKPVPMKLSSPFNAALTLHTEALARPAHDWAGPAAPAPVIEGRSLAAKPRAADKTLPLFEVAEVGALEDDADVEDGGDATGAGHITQRLRAGLARGAKARVR